MDHMLEQLDRSSGTHGGKNPATEPISRKDLLAAWLAGAVDGEGCFHARWGTQTNHNRGPGSDDKRLRISLTIDNTHHLFIRKVTECLLALDVRFNTPANAARPNNRSRAMIQIVIEGKGKLLKLLPAIIPHLANKKRQAELCLELIRYRESLAAAGRDGSYRFRNMNLRSDPKIAWFMGEIKREKWDIPNILSFSRKPNTLFGESSET